jgi:CO/xanthine dehydrogenase Mo-binding subunit
MRLNLERSDASTSVVRQDAYEKMTGGAVYAFDVVQPGMLHAKLLRSPHAHARVRSIKTDVAAGVRGVCLVATADDMPAAPAGLYGLMVKDQPLLCNGKALYIGDPIAAVVAESEESALHALALIEVDYECLASIDTTDDALKPGAPMLFESPQPSETPPAGAGSTHLAEPGPNVLYEYRYETGNTDAMFAQCDYVFEDEFAFSRIHQLHLEPHVTVARATYDGFELWVCNQDPFVLRQDMAGIFGLPEHTIRIHTPYVGGGFGGKSFCKMEPLVAQLAKLAGRPVRLCLTLDESFLTLSQHAATIKMKTGVQKDGRLVARQTMVHLNAGAYSDASALVAIKAGYRAPGPYAWKAVKSVAMAIRTNSVPAGSFRGFGGTQVSYASESQLDMIARRLGLDPVEFRMDNLLNAGDTYMPGDSAIDSHLSDGLRLVQERLQTHDAALKPSAGKKIGKGFAIGFKDAGGVNHSSQAILKVTPSGRAFLSAATVEIGQGAATVLAQIAARILNIPTSWVRYGDIDTNFTPLDHGTHVSSGTTIMGRAVQRATEEVRSQLLQLAARRLACEANDISMAGWRVSKGNESYDLEQMIRGEHGSFGVEIVGKGQFQMPIDRNAPLGVKNPFWIFHWVGISVEVDLETGRVQPLHAVSAVDAGTAINPVLCRGQIEGGFLQGYAQALFEEMVYDGSTPVNLEPLKYRAPLAMDLPLKLESIVLEYGLGPGPFGAKGIGEAGILGVAAAIANAVEDAVGVRIASLPISAEKVYEALALRQATSSDHSAKMLCHS